MWYSRKTPTVFNDQDSYQVTASYDERQLKSRLQLAKAAFSFAAVLSLALSNKALAAGQTLVYTGAENTVTEATAVAGVVVLMGIIGAGLGVIMRNGAIMKTGGGAVVGGGLALGAIQIRDYVFGGAAAGAVIDAITGGAF